jgi:hypothetical protein
MPLERMCQELEMTVYQVSVRSRSRDVASCLLELRTACVHYVPIPQHLHMVSAMTRYKLGALVSWDS